jgi:ABC-type proline/glycine betaine transport system substrate-binding protein
VRSQDTAVACMAVLACACACASARSGGKEINIAYYKYSTGLQMHREKKYSE